MSSLEHTQQNYIEKAEHHPSSSEGIVQVNWNWDDELLVEVTRFALTYSQTVTLAVAHLPMDNCSVQPLLTCEDDKLLEVIEYTSQRFLKGDGIVQVSLNWPDALLAKILRVSFSRAQGAVITISHMPITNGASLSPWEAGYISYHASLPRSFNPHNDCIENCYWWNQGWELAQLEPLPESDADLT